MAIKVVCSSCLRRLKFRDNEAGLNRKCPGCGAEMTVPGEPLPVVESGPPAPGRQREYIIAGVILVIAVVAAVYGVKWWQSSHGEPVNTSNERSRSSQGSSNARTVGKESKAALPVKTISELVDAKEDFDLGPAKVSLGRVALTAETPVLRTRPGRGNLFATVALTLKTVEEGPPFDTFQLGLVTAEGKAYLVLVVSGFDRKREAYELSRKRVTSWDVADGPVTMDLYFEVPTGVDPHACRLRYK